MSLFSQYLDIIMKVMWESEGFSRDMWLIVVYFNKIDHKRRLVLIASVFLVVIHFYYFINTYENDEPNIDVKLDTIYDKKKIKF